MKIGIKAGDLMTRNFISVTPETDLRTCVKTMVKKRVGSLIVKEGTTLKGILTEKDILWAILKKSKKHLPEIKAKDVMKKKVITTKPSADIMDILKKFKKKKIRRIPVVENKKVIGMLTINDILKIDPGLFELLAETIKVKEETKKLKLKQISPHTHFGICEVCGDQTVLYYDGSQWLCERCYSKR